MAHFAELNDSNVVLRVIVISNEDVDANGGDYHADAEAFVKSKFGGHLWKQCSYNNNARKQFAAAGYTYDSSKNKFIRPQPFSSWSLNGDDKWEAPIPYPTITEHGDPVRECVIYWVEEDGGRWQSAFQEDPDTVFHWDPVGLTWVSV